MKKLYGYIRVSIPGHGMVSRTIGPPVFNEMEHCHAATRIGALTADCRADQETQVKALELQRSQLDERQAHLTEAFFEGLIDRNRFEERKNALLLSRKDLGERKALLMQQNYPVVERLNYILELCGIVHLLYKSGFREERRILPEGVSPNRTALVVCSDGKTFLVSISSAYDALAVSEAPSTSSLRVACGNVTHLSLHTLANYGIRNGTHRRGTSRIPGDLETNLQRGSFAQRRAAVRLATHRTLYPTRKASAVGDGVSRATA